MSVVCMGGQAAAGHAVPQPCQQYLDLTHGAPLSRSNQEHQAQTNVTKQKPVSTSVRASETTLATVPKTATVAVSLALLQAWRQRSCDPCNAGRRLFLPALPQGMANSVPRQQRPRQSPGAGGKLLHLR